MLKNITRIVFILFASFSIAQEKNSLLWKISGNGLTKDSYLYGTMHVSQKIAFHLDDVFYSALLKSDFVGLESDPSTWLDHMFKSSDEMSAIRGFLNNNSDFYNSPFKLEEPKQRQIMFYLSREDVLLNGILYRTNQMMQNFQEDTFLDMFIYQTGKKHQKKIFSLEDFETSSLLVKKATLSPKAMKLKPDAWLQKKLKEEGFLGLMNNAYRDRKVSYLDSINAAMYSKSYMKNMLYIRNENMVNSIDSIVKKGSLFSAIGAAHLGGENGVIQMLRAKGYKVEALTSKITSKAELAKKEIENKVIDVQFKTQTADDGFFTALLPNKMYELNILNNTSYISPDLINGAYVIITRMNTFSKLHGKEIKNKNFDKLLFESIPGEIITKKEIKKQGIKGLDILNKTKTGNFQRYQIFFTPLEVLIFKMNGKNDYVKTFGDTFFNSIKFNAISDSVIKVSPKNKGYQVNVPTFHSFINKSYQGNRTIQAIDNDNNYYFLREVALNDINYIEEDKFELERIQERFYKNLNLNYNKGQFTSKDKRSFVSESELESGNKIFLKTVTNGSHYYLLGFITAGNNYKLKDNFFDSFKVLDLEYPKDSFEIKIDTSLYFSVKTNVKPSFNRFDFNQIKENKSYESYTKTTDYINDANEKIFVKLHKLNDLASYANVDSLWNKRFFKADLSRKIKSSTKSKFNFFYIKNSLEKKKVIKGIDNNGNYFCTYYLKDSLSSKAVKVKNIVVQGAIYELKTLVDTVYKESKFVKEFYSSFKPKDTVLGKPLFVDKTTPFFKALKNKDSIVLDGYNQVNFKKKDVKKIIDILDSYEFDDNQLKIKKYLIEELSQFNSKKVKRFLDDVYIKSFQNPANQIAIINAVLKTNSKESYKRFLKLLESDVPLSSNSFQMNSMIASVNDSLLVSKNLFPELLNYTAIEEYKKPIYKLLVDLLDNKIVTSLDYKTYQKQILNQARVELKRQLGKKSDIDSYTTKTDGDLLILYVKLLFPFRKNKNVKTFFKNINYIKNAAIKSTLMALQINASEKYNKEVFRDLVENLSSRGILYKELYKVEKTSIFPKEFNNKKEIYKAFLFESNFKKELKDSIVYLGNRSFKILKSNFEIYFYKSKIHKNNTQTYDKDWKMNYIILENKGNEISVDSILIIDGKNLDATKTITEIIDNVVEESRLKNRKRVNLDTRGRRNGMF